MFGEVYILEALLVSIVRTDLYGQNELIKEFQKFFDKLIAVTLGIGDHIC